MTQLPLISVIVPVYKVENYLDCCVQSIVNQTYSNLEIILIDDGSPDASGAMCDAWAEKDSRIRVIHQENAGGGAARNAGLDAARGERIAFVDSDDYIAPGCYQYLHTLLEEGADIAECDFVETERNDAVFGTDAGEISFYTPLEAYRQQPDSVMHGGFSLRRLEGVQAQEQRLAYLKTHMPSLEYEGRANLFLYCQYAMQMSIQYLSGEELRQAKESLRKTVSGLTPLLPSRKLSPAGNVWLVLGQLSFEGSCRLMNCLERRNGKGSE